MTSIGATPPSLSRLAAPIVLANFKNGEGLTKAQKQAVKTNVFSLWESLKMEAFNARNAKEGDTAFASALVDRMVRIEVSCILSQSNAGTPLIGSELQCILNSYTPDEKSEILIKKINVLFRNLLVLADVNAFTPFDYSSYVRDRQEGAALEVLWKNEIVPQLRTPPRLATIRELRQWIAAKENAEQLSAIKEIRALVEDRSLLVIPPQVKYFSHLESIAFNEVNIPCFPESLTSLTQLRALRFDSNNTSCLPPSFTRLVHLQSLNLYNNMFTAIPIQLDKLTLLTDLDLSNNPIGKCPDSLSVLANLTELRFLDLQTCRLTAYPASISFLTKLKKLDLSNNFITRLPDSLPLTCLERLNLNNNSLTCLPDSFIVLVNNNPEIEVAIQENSLWSDFEDIPNLHRELTLIEWTLFSKKIISQYLECKEYKCLTPLSSIYQLIICNCDDREIQAAFEKLKSTDKTPIYGFVQEQLGPLEKRIFDDMDLFKQAVRFAVIKKYPQLTDHSKGVKPIPYSNVLQLIDAMDADAMTDG